MASTNKRAGEEYPITLRKRRRIEEEEPEASMESEELESGSGGFPSDMVIAILSRVPVKALFRFKSVCTNWDAAIPGNPRLVSMHLKNFTKASLFCSYLEDDGSSSGRHPPRSVSLCPEDDGDQPPTDERLPAETVICGTGNGLFLLRDNHHRSAPHPVTYHLWNPATRETRRLPDPPLALFQRHCSDYAGIGLDSDADDDIKVVLIRKYHDLVAAFVYSLRSNRWRELEAAAGGGWAWQQLQNPCSPTLTCHTYFKGSFYWLVRDLVKVMNYYVLAFDMGSHVFRRIDCPSGGDGVGPEFHLGLYGDSLALFKGPVWSYSRVDVWLLSGGDDLCWIKHPCSGPLRTQSIVEGGWKSGQLIARTHGPASERKRLILLDIGRQEHKLLIPNCRRTVHWHVYKQSLLPIKLRDRYQPEPEPEPADDLGP
ncbi:unnamed protein product [Linum trigynum]|uniref:F-box domain-containing protein n=1 Tax=Linum trigynum TaxID=586398 RepID=A0AAV2CUS4_9ROSI